MVNYHCVFFNKSTSLIVAKSTLKKLNDDDIKRPNIQQHKYQYINLN